MTKLNKRVIDSLLPLPDRDIFVWDGEVRGFGLRLKPSGVKTYFIQYRNADGRTRRMVIGKHGILTTEQARDLARKQLTEVLNGEDPSAKRRAARSGMTVADICDWYLTEGRAGRLLGRNRRPIKASTLDGDEGRINVHIKPLIGGQLVRGIILVDVEKLQAKIASGRPARDTKRRDRGGQTKGGAGVASRTISTLRSMFGHAKRFGLIETNPALGVRVIAGKKKLRRLSREELGRLGTTMAMMEEQGEHPIGLAAIRTMLLTGFRKMEVLGMRRAWIDVAQQASVFPIVKPVNKSGSLVAWPSTSWWVNPSEMTYPSSFRPTGATGILSGSFESSTGSVHEQASGTLLPMS